MTTKRVVFTLFLLIFSNLDPFGTSMICLIFYTGPNKERAKNDPKICHFTDCTVQTIWCIGICNDGTDDLLMVFITKGPQK